MAAPKIRLVLSESNVSIANNTSVVKAVMYYDGNGETYNASASCKITINGSSKSFKNSVTTSTKNKKMGEYSVTVKHNADGSKTVSYSGSCAASDYYGPSTASGTFKCQTIPRATTPKLKKSDGSATVSSAALGAVVRIDVSGKASSAFTHDVTYKLGKKSGTIYTGLKTYLNWTVPTSLADQMPSSASGTMTITCETKNGSTVVGTKSVTLKITVPNTADYIPKISGITVTELTSGLASKFGVFVQDKSKLKIVVSQSAGNGSSVKQTKVSVDGKTYIGATVQMTTPISEYGTVSIGVTVTDNRNRIKTATYTKSITQYYSPKISSLKAVRCNSDGTGNDSGAYIKISYTVDVAPVGNKNSKSAVLKYKKQSASSYTSVNIPLSTYKQTGSKIISASTESSYDISFSVTDYFKTVTSSAEIGTAFTLMDFHSSGTGIGIGKVAEKSDTLDIGLDLVVKGVNYTADGGWKGLTLESAKWGEYNSSSNFVVYKKVGRVVDMRCYVKAKVGSDSVAKVKLASGLPKNCQPTEYTVRCACARHNGGYGITIPYNSAEDAGTIYFYGKMFKGYAMWFQITYVV